jgi:hypothetical protein
MLYLISSTVIIWCAKAMVIADKAAGVNLLMCHAMKWVSHVGLDLSLVTPVASTHRHVWSHA